MPRPRTDRHARTARHQPPTPTRRRLSSFRLVGRRRTFALGVPAAAILSVAVLGGSGWLAPPTAPGDASPASAQDDPGRTPQGQEPEGQAPDRQTPEGQTPQGPSGPRGGTLAGGAPTGSEPSDTSQPPPATGTAGTLAPEELTGYVWPVRGGRITSFFARRDGGFLIVDGKAIHEGLDVATFCGDPVRAAHGGVVLAAGRRALVHQGFYTSMSPYYQGVQRRGTRQSLSISVVIDDGNGYRSVYAHLWDATVRPGDVVSAGDHIGLQGNTGFATGCHLHYELIRMDGRWMQVNPKYVKDYDFPAWTRERIDPMRVLSLDRPGRPTYLWGVRPPKESPGLGRPTAPPVLEPRPEVPSDQTVAPPPP